MNRLVPLTLSLLLCAAGVVALHVGSARAGTPRQPMMVAMLTPRLPLLVTAAPAPEGGNPPVGRRPGAVAMATLHKQMCQDNYAHEVGQLAYLEARLELGANQRPLFDRWKAVRLDIARRSLADCSTTSLSAQQPARPTPAEAMAREEETLKHRLADLEAERPVLAALYNSLNASQQEALSNPDNVPMGSRMAGRRRLAGDSGPPPPDTPPPGPGAPPP